MQRNSELQERLTAIAPDAILVVAYGRIIPEWMLALPRFGNINLHGSLLPKYRGAAPIQWAVANGETETGVSTMRLDVGLDTGDVLLESRVTLGADAMARDLFHVLAAAGASLMLRTLDGLSDGTIVPKPQDHARATLAPILTRDDGRLRLAERTAQVTYNRGRGLNFGASGFWCTGCGSFRLRCRLRWSRMSCGYRMASFWPGRRKVRLWSLMRFRWKASPGCRARRLRVIFR